MNKKIPLPFIIKSIAGEKGVDEDVIIDAVQAALVSATKKKYGANINIIIDIDKKTNTYNTYRSWVIVEDPLPGEALLFPLTEITLSAAQIDDPHLQAGDSIREKIESVEFSRISAYAAKQVIIQKVREAERSLIVKNFSNKIGELLIGIVKKVTKDSTILDFSNNADGILKKENTLLREAYRYGDRVRVCLTDVISSIKGPQLIVSRTCNTMLTELFKIEVPEVGEGIIEIKSVARDPGIRSKIAVKTNDGRLDPQGACIGMRGSRVQAVSNELEGERIDIVLWDSDPAQFAMNAMSPAEITTIVVDEENKIMEIGVVEEFLSQAIGKNGQNVKLASMLIGWQLNIINSAEAQEKDKKEIIQTKKMFIDNLNISEDIAVSLVTEGFTSLEEIAYVPIQEMLDIDNLNNEIIEKLKTRSKEVLLNESKTIIKTNNGQVNNDLLSIDGIDTEIVNCLNNNNIISREDVANLSIDELLDVLDLDKKHAAKIIMSAREHWFNIDSK